MYSVEYDEYQTLSIIVYSYKLLPISLYHIRAYVPQLHVSCIIVPSLLLTSVFLFPFP